MSLKALLCPCGERPARHARRKEARPGELLAAALDLFVEKGYAATRVEEVAHRAGVSKGTLFLYFPTKEDLFKAVVRENISGRYAQWNEELERFEGDGASLLRYTLQTWWERVGSTKAGGISKLILAEARNFPELAAFYQQEVIIPGTRLLTRILQRGVDRGEFALHDVDHTVSVVMAPMLFLAIWRNSMDSCVASASLDPEGFLDTLEAVLLNGVLVRPGSTKQNPSSPPSAP